MVTAGPTYEKIDPVRFVGNYSSGKMGFAIAGELAGRGARVTLVCGPVSLKIFHPGIERMDVESASHMRDACLQVFPETDGAVMCAAVADYRPKSYAAGKIKRSRKHMLLELVPNDDIAALLGSRKSEKQILVGFALETGDELTHAAGKMEKKNLDFIVLNSLRDPGAGFGVDTNKISILTKEKQILSYPLKTKADVARDIVEEIVRRMETLI